MSGLAPVLAWSRLFLPFRNATSGQKTYGGGRYLYDTIKGADLGIEAEEIGLDFNYDYNPSCAYNNTQWVCPLAPPENRLPFAVEAGEKVFCHKKNAGASGKPTPAITGQVDLEGCASAI